MILFLKAHACYSFYKMPHNTSTILSRGCMYEANFAISLIGLLENRKGVYIEWAML